MTKEEIVYNFKHTLTKGPDFWRYCIENGFISTRLLKSTGHQSDYSKGVVNWSPVEYITLSLFIGRDYFLFRGDKCEWVRNGSVNYYDIKNFFEEDVLDMVASFEEIVDSIPHLIDYYMQRVAELNVYGATRKHLLFERKLWEKVLAYEEAFNLNQATTLFVD